MFQTVPLSIIRSFSLYTQQLYMSYRFCWQLASRIRMEHHDPVWHIRLLHVQWKTPDDGQRNCPKHTEFHSTIKFQKLVHLGVVGFIIRIILLSTICYSILYTKGEYITWAYKMFNNLPSYMKDISNNVRKFEICLKRFQHIHSFYSIEEYFQYKSITSW